MNQILKISLTLMVSLSIAGNIFASSFEANGIHYNILSGSDKAVAVTSNPNKYEGDITIPEKVSYNGQDYAVTTIEMDAFFSCNALNSVIIGNSVTTIDRFAFDNCQNLKSLKIGSGVSSIGRRAFYDCASLPAITVDDSNAFYVAKDGALYTKDMKNLIFYPQGKEDTSFSIPEGVENIAIDAFAGCKRITSVTIPNSVKTLEKSAFYYCTQLSSLSLGSSITDIGEEAFLGCLALTSITLPKSVKSLGGAVFNGCKALTEINVENGNSAYAAQDGVLYSADKSRLIAYPAGKTAISYSIPSGTTSIDNSAFAYNKSLTAVTIPSSITTIGNNAFFYCVALESISLPNSVSTVGKGVFANCTALKSATLPEALTTVSSSLFMSCSALQFIKIPDNVTLIDESAFSYCSALTSIVIPDKVTSIGEYAFCLIPSLSTLTIGSSVKSIGDYAFSECAGIETIYCKPTTPPQYIASDTPSFAGGIYATATLYVPSGAKEAYATTAPWSKFTTIEEMEFGGIQNVDNSSISVTTNNSQIVVTGLKAATTAEVFSASGQLIYRGTDTSIDVPNRGLYIVRIAGQSFKVIL